MANTDSFISEVTEEVRRDQLFRLFKRWGWVGGLLVVGIVGGAAYFEYQRAQTEASARAFGDAILSALNGVDPEARIGALEDIAATGPEGEILLALIAANEALTAEDPAPAAARLRAAAEAPDLQPRYRDLALLKAEMLDPSESAQARLILGALAQPGAPYAALAQEQLALLDIRDGDLEAGIDALRALERSAAAPPGLQQRASQLIVALEAGSSLIDSRPEPEPEPEPEPAPEEGDTGASEEGPVEATETGEPETGTEEAGESEAGEGTPVESE